MQERHCDVTLAGLAAIVTSRYACGWMRLGPAICQVTTYPVHLRMDPGGHPRWQDPKGMFPTQRS